MTRHFHMVWKNIKKDEKIKYIRQQQHYKKKSQNDY